LGARQTEWTRIVTTELDGFNIEPYSGSFFLFQWMIEPRHAFKFEITSKRATLVETIPAVVAGGDDALVLESKARKAADKYRRKLFGSMAA
jgi:hypothetical protein